MRGDFYFQSMQIEKLYALFKSSTGVTTDTRSIAEGNIFFALKGDKFNANEFAEEALNKGAAYVVVDEIIHTEWIVKYSTRIIQVNDSLKTLQQLAGHHRQQFNCPVLAITGSNGKTTTKELIAAVISAKYKTYSTKGNLNNHIGIPLTLLSIKEDVQFAVIEMGANHQGEIASYCEYVRPDYGIITNVGMAHTEGFGGFEGVVKGKTELYADLVQRKGKVFVSSENEILQERISNFQFPITDVVRYGKSSTAFCSGALSDSKEFLSIKVDEEVIKTNLVGDYNFENVLCAICVGRYFGVEMSRIKKAIENYVASNNRSQKIVSGTNTIILDAYNANPSSMKAAIENFGKLSANKKILILGEMMELGAYSATEHRCVKEMADGIKAELRIFVGEGFAFLSDAEGVLYFRSTDDLKKWYTDQHFDNCTILIKGSRKNELERLLAG